MATRPTPPFTLPAEVWIGVDAWLELADLAQACGVEPDYIQTLVVEGLVEPVVSEPGWRFGADELARVRRIQRLQNDFQASLDSVALMLDLLDEIDRLRGLLQRAGLRG